MGERHDFGQFCVLDIMQELTPANDGWKHDLSTTGIAVFTYHHFEYVTVFFDWGEDCTIDVMDREITVMFPKAGNCPSFVKYLTI